jgi:SRSO17 transposase
MKPHSTASLKNTKRKAEESGGEPFGLAPFLAFVQDFNPSTHHRTRALFNKCAPQYLSGLIAGKDRRNIEKISENIDQTQYQNLHHFITHSPWSDERLYREVSQFANRLLGGSKDSALFIDPSGIPKKGDNSIGVSRQYCGATGKIDNCQVGVFSALVKDTNVVVINKRLYLPKSWCADSQRCDKAKVPIDARIYKTNQTLAMELIQDADSHGLDYSWVGLDAEFGTVGFLSKLADMGKEFMIDVRTNTHVYLFNPRLSQAGKNQKCRALRRKRKPVKVGSISKAGRWKKVIIRDASKGPMAAKMRSVPVWIWNGKQDAQPLKVHLVIRKLEGDPKGRKYKYSLSNADQNTCMQRLAYQQSQRFWVEKGIKDCKDGLGIDEYQTRQWKSWHHHVALTLLAGVFLMKLKLEEGKSLPLLSIYDLKDLLTVVLPLRKADLETVWTIVLKRHQRKVWSKTSAENRQRSRLPNW